MACYNASRFLRAAVDSAFAQTYLNIEVVAVDDGSTDNTAKILRSYGDKVILVSQTNAGVSAARNAGIARASGDVIVLLDSDDVLAPECVAERVRLLGSRPNVGLVTGLTRYIDEHGQIIPRAVDLKPSYPNGVSYVEAMRRFPGPPSGWAIPKRILQEAGGFDESLRSAEDHDLCLRILARHECLCDPVARTFYREVTGSLSRNPALNYDQVRRVIRKNRPLAPIGAVAYWWQSRVMLLTAVAGAFTRIFREGGGAVQALTLLLKRPGTLPFFLVWSGRAVWNRILYAFGRGPIREKEKRIA